MPTAVSGFGTRVTVLLPVTAPPGVVSETRSCRVAVGVPCCTTESGITAWPPAVVGDWVKYNSS